MSEEQMDTMPDDIEIIESDPTIDLVQNTMDTFLSAADVEAVYAEPIETDDTLIIPTAEVLAAMGFGFASGYSESGEDEDSDGGSGGGGGGRVLSRPVAVIISSPEGVRVEPVIDITKIALAAFTTFGFMFSMLMRIKRKSKE